MNTLTFTIGVIGNVISVLVFLSPVPTFWRIVKHRSTEEFESLPYICTILNSALWVYYGVTRPGSYLVATINGFGVVAEIVFVALFLIFAPTKSRGKTLLLVGILDVGFLIAAILATQLLLRDVNSRIDVLGVLCAGLNILMYGSPLAVMKRVITTKSVEYMPFFLSFFLFLNGGIWATYAILVHDWFLLVANGIGFLLGTAQLLLYATYRNSKVSKDAAISDMEEAFPTEPLLPSSSLDPSSTHHTN